MRADNRGQMSEGRQQRTEDSECGIRRAEFKKKQRPTQYLAAPADSLIKKKLQHDKCRMSIDPPGGSNYGGNNWLIRIDV